MTGATGNVMHATQSEADSESARHWRRITVLAVAIVVLIAGIGIGLDRLESWKTHDHVLFPGGDEQGQISQVGRTVYFGLGVFPRGDNKILRLDVESVTPLITQNSARATVTVLRCSTPQESSPYIGLTTGGDAYNPHQYCASITPFRPGTVALGGTYDGYIARITTHAPGVVMVSGWRIKYKDGWRSGNQVAGIWVRVRATSGRPKP